MSSRAIIFGASGALGGAVLHCFRRDGVDAVPVSREPVPDKGWVNTSSENWTRELGSARFDRVVFAHGENSAGGIATVAVSEVARIIDANVLSIIRWLQDLRNNNLLSENCRVCILGSIWANIVRPEKLSYVVSKAAVSGLVRSLAVDLADEGIVVNAVLPGVVDTPMTRNFLSYESIGRLVAETPGHQLASASEIAEVCVWLTSKQSMGIRGQSIVVDNGWSITRHV